MALKSNRTKPSRAIMLAAIVSWIAVILVSVFEIERNWLHGIFVRGQRYIFSKQIGNLFIDITGPYPIGAENASPDARYRLIKLSFPFGSIVSSCDRVYGAAIYDFSKPESPIARRRMTFTFAYDIANGRCESKQLFLDDYATPETIDIQLSTIDETRDSIIEQPFLEGFRLKFLGQPFDPAITEVETRTFEPIFPYLKKEITPIIKTFSADLSPRNLKIMTSPGVDLEDQLVTAIEKFIERCPDGPNCGPLRVAVARIDDDRFWNLFAKAREKGIETEVVLNFRPWIGGPDLRVQNKANEVQPIEWLFANPYIPYRPELRLPMHTKFIILGNEQVFSGINLYFSRYPYARQSIVEYSDPRVVAMFNETFTRIKTGAFANKHIDLARDFSLMIGGEMVQRVAAIRKTVSPGVITEDGLHTTAYGVALHLLDQAKSSLTVSMTPLSDACHRFGSALCFFDILKRQLKVLNGKLYENPRFYLDPTDGEGFDKFQPNGIDLAQLPKMREYFKALEVDPDSVTARRLAYMLAGTFHHRAMILDHKTIITGSVNLAHESTVNTVEVIRSESLARKMEAEIDPGNQPYYISPIMRELDISEEQNFQHDRNCLFVYEYPLIGARAAPVMHHYEFDEIAARLSTKNLPLEEVQKLSAILPESVADIPPNENKLVRAPIANGLKSASQYLCLEFLEPADQPLESHREHIILNMND